MIRFGGPLPEHAAVRRAQQRVVCGLVGGRGGHHEIYDAFEVLEAEACGAHGIGITDRF